MQTRSVVSVRETPAQKEKRIAWLLTDYGRFFFSYYPRTTATTETGKHTDCAPFQIKAAHTLRDHPTIQYAAQWARGHAKSVHFDVGIPMYLKALKKLHLMVLVGKSKDNAETLLGDIQAEFEFNQRYISDFGVQKVTGSWGDRKVRNRRRSRFLRSRSRPVAAWSPLQEVPPGLYRDR